MSTYLIIIIIIIIFNILCFACLFSLVFLDMHLQSKISVILAKQHLAVSEFKIFFLLLFQLQSLSIYHYLLYGCENLTSPLTVSVCWPPCCGSTAAK